MNRDELIVNMIPHIKKLVKKMNNGEEDEDLESIGMIAVIKCVDKSLNVDYIKTIDDITARSYVWAKNAILNELMKNRVEIDESYNINYTTDSINLEDCFLIEDIRKELNKMQTKVFNCMLEGKNVKEICKELSISERNYFYITKKIKKIFAFFDV